MSRDRNYRRHTSRHTKDSKVSAGVSKFISFLEERGENINWFGSRESDVIRLEASHNGLQVKLTHMFPESHPDYVDAHCMCSGNRDDEFLVEVRDMSRRYRLVNLIKEHFDEDSPFFQRMNQVFDLLSSRTKIVSSATRETLEYGKAVRKAVKLLDSFPT